VACRFGRRREAGYTILRELQTLLAVWTGACFDERDAATGQRSTATPRGVSGSFADDFRPLAPCSSPERPA
jgi:hypothetical protein